MAYATDSRLREQFRDLCQTPRVTRDDLAHVFATIDRGFVVVSIDTVPDPRVAPGVAHMYRVEYRDVSGAERPNETATYEEA